MHAATDLEQRSACAPGTAKSCGHTSAPDPSYSCKFLKHGRQNPKDRAQERRTAGRNTETPHTSTWVSIVVNFVAREKLALQTCCQRTRSKRASAPPTRRSRNVFAEWSTRVATQRIPSAVAETRWHHACQTSRIFSLVLVGALSSCREAPSSKENKKKEKQKKKEKIAAGAASCSRKACSGKWGQNVERNPNPGPFVTVLLW